MSDRTTLRVRPDPIFDESPYGYVERLVDVNGLDSDEHFLDIMGKEGRREPSLLRLVQDEAATAQLEFFLRKPSGSIASHTFPALPSTRELFLNYRGAPLPCWMLRRHTRAVCVLCLHEAAYIRTAWDLAAVQSCTRHRRALETHCQRCKAAISPWRRSLLHCGKCGEQFRAGRASVDGGQLDNAQWVESALMNSRPTVEAPDWDFSKANFAALLALAIDLVRGPPRLNRVALKVDAAWSDREAVNVAIDAVRHRPKLTDLYYRVLLERKLEMPGLGLLAWKLPILQRLNTTQFKSPEFDPLRDLLREACERVKSAKPVPVNIALRARGGAITPQHLGAVLGINYGRLLTEETQAGFKQLGLPSPRSGSLSWEQLESWIANLRRLPVSAADSPEICLGELFQNGTLAMAGRSLWKLLGAIKAGDFPIASWHPWEPLSELKVSQKQVRGFLRPRKAKDGYLSVPQVAKRLGMYPDAVYRLIGTGKIPIERGALQRSENQICMSETAFDAFNAEFVFAGTLAKLYGAGTTSFADKLRHAGAEPVSGPGIDSGLVYLFRRRDLIGLDMQAVAELTTYKSRSGRPKAGAVTPRRALARLDLVDSQTVAKRLGVTVFRLGVLVAKGVLPSVQHASVLGNRRYFERTVVDTFCKQYLENPKWIRLEQAMTMFGMSRRAFEKNWIFSGRLAKVTDHLGEYINTESVKRALAMNREWLTGKQAQELIGIDKCTLANWQKLGRIKPVSGPGIDSFRNYLFARTDVQNLVQYIRINKEG